jgi:hypothetical protein
MDPSLHHRPGGGREGNPRTAPTIATRDHRMRLRPAPDRTLATTGCDCGPRPIGQPRAHEKGNMPKGKRRHGMGTPGVKDGPPPRQPHPKDRPYRNQRQVRPHPEKEHQATRQGQGA